MVLCAFSNISWELIEQQPDKLNNEILLMDINQIYLKLTNKFTFMHEKNLEKYYY